MSNFHPLRSSTAIIVALGLTAGAVAPIVQTAPVYAQTSFYDVPAGYWAQDFIQALAARNIIAGFPDGSFRPNEPVTRAQFAAMINRAFNQPGVRQPVSFVDVPLNFWAEDAIQKAYTTGFMAGYPGNVFNPGQNIPRAQVIVSLASGLNYTASAASNTVLQQYYNDAVDVPDYARNAIAAATERRIVVNYPDIRVLNPNQAATRAEVAALIYQALASTGSVAAINSPYIVGQAATPTPPRQVRIPSGTTIPVRYTQAERILVTPDETAPLTLTVGQNITTAQGAILIPSGSQVVGELRPAQGGSQFVARELVLANGQRIPMSATSQVITKTEEIRKGANTGSILQGAVLGAGAAAGVSAVTGDQAIATEEVLGGAGIGALLGLFLGRERITLIAIDPNTDLNLTLTSDLTLNVGS